MVRYFKKNDMVAEINNDLEIIKDLTDNGFVEMDSNEIDSYLLQKQQQEDKAILHRISEIKTRLEQLSQDIVQSLVGAEFEDLADRQAEFQTLHNELRVLLGKEPRKYLEVDNETNN